MATSGSVNYSATRVQLVTEALIAIGVLGEGRTATDYMLQRGNYWLNTMLKAWQGKGMHIFRREKALLFADRYTAKHTLSNGASSAKCCLESDAVITQLNGEHAASDTTLVVDSTTGMTAADNIGIVLSSGAMHWTTIVSVDSSTGLTLTSGLASAASDDAMIYTFTNRINKPMRVYSMRRVSGVDSSSTTTRNELPLQPYSIEEYEELPTKTSNSSYSLGFSYVPKLTSGDLFLWPRPSDMSQYYELSFERMIEDMDAASDDFDFPSEWLEAITLQLAARLTNPFRCVDRNQNIIQMAQLAYDNMLRHDSEPNSLYMSVNSREY